ncbi:hypothetical protein HDV05_000045 [Chytridiales sp. JEL 0842]|nr:hypothetical protein HDV05_000045 [Chytridiales sp. JEL 0842]
MTSSQLRCCDTPTITDDFTGSTVCQVCGTIVDEGQIYTTVLAEDEGVAYDKRTGFKKSAGTGATPLIHRSQKGKKQEEFRKLARGAEHALKIPGTAERVLELFDTANEELGFGHGRRGKIALGACICVVIRERQLPVSPEAVARYVACDDHYYMGRIFKRIKDRLKLSHTPHLSPFQIIRKACPKLLDLLNNDDFDLQKATETVLSLADLSGLNEGRRQAPLAAAALVMAYESLVREKANTEIVERICAVVECSSSMAKLRYKELSNIMWEVAQRVPWHQDLKKGEVGKYYKRLPEILESAETILLREQDVEE